MQCEALSLQCCWSIVNIQQFSGTFNCSFGGKLSNNSESGKVTLIDGDPFVVVTPRPPDRLDYKNQVHFLNCWLKKQ